MLKRLVAGALALALTLAAPPADAAGLWPLSYSQRHDANGRPFPGAKAYFYDAETGDPIAVFREYSLATPHPNPVEADGNGVFPGVFIDGAEEFYRFRVTTAEGVILSDDAVVPNIGPAEGEGGEPAEPVEATALAKTGDIKARYGEGTHVGWLPCSGQTMGSALSGADHASGDNEALFLYLWAIDLANDPGQTDPAIVVTGGRGLSAAADWQANKRISLPDMRGRVLAGLDDMGGNVANILPGLDALGEAMGVHQANLAVNQVPEMNLGSVTVSTAPEHGHPIRVLLGDDGGGAGGQGGFVFDQNTNRSNTNGAFVGTPTDNVGQQLGGAGSHTHTVTGKVGTAAGSLQALSKVQPVRGLTFYIKL